MRIASVVVTYNRKDLLRECLSAILKQVKIPQVFDLDIIVVDNASTDGTEEAVRELAEGFRNAQGEPSCSLRYGDVEEKYWDLQIGPSCTIRYYNTGENLGGAGGFQHGIRKAVELGYDYLWLMDDDCIPTETALSALIAAGRKISSKRGDDSLTRNGSLQNKPAWGFLSSKVLWRDGSICRMNVQRRTMTRNVTDFSPHQIMPVVMASFVSLFVPAAVIRELGLPIKEFFIWTDDWEWTRRISRKYPCYLVTDSVVTHKSKMNIKADIANETVDRLDRFYYLYRNDVVLYRREGFKGFAYECVRLSGHVVRVLRKSDHKWSRIGKIIQGTAAGVGFKPGIEYVE